MNPMRWASAKTKLPREAGRRAILVVSTVLMISAARLCAQDPAPRVLEVYWQSSRSIAIPGITTAVVLDDSICRAQVSEGKVELAGLTRGETVVFVWAHEQRINLRIRVVARPMDLPPPRLSNADLDAMGRGYLGSTMQTSLGNASAPGTYWLHHLEWEQQNHDSRLRINAQVQDSTLPGAPLFNPNTASIQYSTPHKDLWLMDLPLSLNGGVEAKVSPYSTYNVYMIRGAEVVLKHGANQFEFFGGATIPSYFLTLEGTRDVAGFNFDRHQTDKLYLYATTAWVNSPLQFSPLNSRRENSFFQTVGLAYRPDSRWAIQGTLGASTLGGLAQGTVSYSGERFNAFFQGTDSTPTFPLNQLQLFFAGGSSVTAGGSLKVDSHLSGSLYFQHSSTQSTVFYPVAGDSDYFNPGLTIALSSSEVLTLNYNYTRNRSGQTLLGRSQGRRYDVALNSRFGARLSNTAEFTSGALSDPLQLNAQGEFTARDVLSIPVRSSFLTFGFEHTRNDPSLVNRLKSDLGLLSPALQQMFLLDPLGFTQSSQLPPEVVSLLQNLNPTDTQISVSGQFKMGARLSLSPTVGYARNMAGLGQGSSSDLFGYAMSYQVSHSVQLVSSLSNVLMYDYRRGDVRRATVMTIGLNKALSGAPRWLQPFRETRRTIRGRVFSDLNVNGTFNEGEPGLADVRVDLSTGESVRTNEQGIYEFTGLKPDAYRVSVPLDQFKNAVRATGPADIRVDLLEDKAGEVNFGIVNFARVMGMVFNDYNLDGRRQPDAPGLRGIRLVLAGAHSNYEIVTDGTGSYELSEVVPGDYRLAVDRSSLPADYVAPERPSEIHVASTSTVVTDVPLRALRSLAGHIYFKAASGQVVKTNASSNPSGKVTPGHNPNDENGIGNSTLQPLAGVRISVGKEETTTDANGAFVLRNLPAGDLVLTLIPAIQPPSGLAMPQGHLRMPREPIQAEDAKIVISNPELLNYLLPLPSGLNSGK